MAETVADVVIGVSADVGPLMRETSRAGKAMDRFSADTTRGFGNVGAAMGRASVAAASFGVSFAKGLALGIVSGGLVALSANMRTVIGGIADMADAADRVGLSAANFQQLQFGMKLAGVSADEFSSAITKFSDNIGDAVRGSTAFGTVLKENNIDLLDAEGAVRNTSDLLADFADVIQRVPDEATRMSMITEAFGKSGKAMTLAMADGSAGIDQMKRSAIDAGVVLDQTVVDKARILDDQFDVLTAKVDTFFKNVVVGAADGAVAIAQMLDAAVTSDAAEPIIDVQASYDMDALTSSARTLSNAIGMTSVAMSELENSTASAMVLSGLADEVDQLTVNLQNGSISTQQYQDGLQNAVAKADSFLISLGEINGIDMAGARMEIASIGGVIDGLIGKAVQAAVEIAALSAGPVISHGGRAEAPEYVSTLAPGTSPRPERPGIDSGVPDAPSGGGGGGGGGGGSVETALDALIADLETEREVVEAWYAESAVLLANATEAQLAQLGGRHDAIERLEKEHQERLSGIRGIGDDDALANSASFFGSLATITQAGGEKANKAYRAFAAAEALINAYRAASQALADPKLNFFAKFAAVATTLAAGMGLVSALKSGGSGSGSSSRGAASSGGGIASGGPQSVANITLNGDMFSRSSVEELFAQINGGLKQGRIINLVSA